MSRFSICVLLPSDLAPIRQLLTDLHNFVEREIAAAVEVCEEAARHPFQEYYGYCAKEDDRVVGFIVFGVIPMTERCWDLYWLAVAPAFARQGVGQRLAGYMEKIIVEAQGRQIHVDTSSLPAYLPACRFYDKVGFALRARLADFYRVGADKLIYVKDLNGQLPSCHFNEAD
ncbi:MAG: GNAT family N-acetyltransferase [Desulfobulbaceae bacterium]|nr:GNAT family N-acetyltransferase [Desulfobulbaceae bacterium]